MRLATKKLLFLFQSVFGGSAGTPGAGHPFVGLDFSIAANSMYLGAT
jgi:hypothetical protein